jgi:hypothetical protein
MSSDAGIEALLRVVAETAAARRPLQDALRERCGALGAEIAARIDRGEDLPSALQRHLGADLCAILAGPRPSLEDAALFAAERLQLERRVRHERLDALLHPVLTAILVAAAAAAALAAAHLRIPWPCVALAGAPLAAAAVLAVLTARPERGAALPALKRFAFHLRMSLRYERAALVARWRLPDAQLERLLGEDIAELTPFLSHPEAAEDALRLAAFHRQAAVRCRRRLSALTGGLVYLAGGAVVLAAASASVGTLLGALSACNS